MINVRDGLVLQSIIRYWLCYFIFHCWYLFPKFYYWWIAFVILFVDMNTLDGSINPWIYIEITVIQCAHDQTHSIERNRWIETMGRSKNMYVVNQCTTTWMEVSISSIIVMTNANHPGPLKKQNNHIFLYGKTSPRKILVFLFWFFPLVFFMNISIPRKIFLSLGFPLSFSLDFPLEFAQVSFGLHISTKDSKFFKQ